MTLHTLCLPLVRSRQLASRPQPGRRNPEAERATAAPTLIRSSDSMKKVFIIAVLLLTAFVSEQQYARAQTGGTCGLMIMAHGGGEQWNAAVETAAAPLRSEIPVSIAFGMADPHSLTAAVEELEAQQVACIVVVRLFMSAHSFLHQTEYLLGVRADPPDQFISHGGHRSHESMPPPVPLRAKVLLSREALLDAPEMGNVLARNALAMSDSSEAQSVLIVAHGAGNNAVNAEWLQKLDRLAGAVRATGQFRSVAVYSLREDWSGKRKKSEEEIRGYVETHSQAGGRVLVVPFRLYGFGPYAKVLDGLSYHATGQGLLPSPEVTDWIRQTARKLIAQISEDLLPE